MKKFSILFFCSMMIFLSSCVTQRIMLVRGAKVQEDNPTYNSSQAFFVGGIGQTQRINVNEACRGRTPIAIDMQFSALDAVLGNLTRGIYTPRTLKVYCQ